MTSQSSSNSEMNPEHQKLIEENELLKAIINAIPEPIVAKNWQGNFIFANEAVAKLYNTTPEAMIGHDDGYFTGNQEQADFFRKNVQDIMRRYEPEMVYEDSTDAATGEIRHFHSLKIPFTDAKGNLNISVIAKDITEVTRIKDQALENEKRLNFVLQATGEGIWDFHVPTGIVRHNQKWTALAGHDKLQNHVDDIVELIHPDDREDFYKVVDATLKNGQPYNHKFRFLHKSGKVVWVHDKGEVVEYDEHGQAVRMVGAIHDITQEVEQKDQIEKLAFYDPLTNLPNRRLLNDRLEQSIHHHQVANTYGALLFMDLDHFKLLNDIHGHYMGDQLLVEISQRLQKRLNSDDTVARFGGDEFVIILHDLDSDPTKAGVLADTIATDLKEIISKPCYLYSDSTDTVLEYEVTSSTGIVIFPSESDNPESLVQLADMALYKAKEDGRDSCVSFKQDMQQDLDNSIMMQRDLKKAVHEELLELHFQPKYDKNLKLIGAEGLVRWHSELKGDIPPAEFIEVAEESNLILPLGNWVLKQATAQLQKWSKNSLLSQLNLAVNVSAKQIWQNDFVEFVESLLVEKSFEPSLLTLEITESVMVRDFKETVKKLEKLKQMGVRISLDDFGTGYSSLNYLTKLPVDEIKIDASFVRDIVQDPSDLMMVKAINHLGDSFYVDVVAEGVETESHLKCLQQVGVDFYQGFLFSKALSLHDFENLEEFS